MIYYKSITLLYLVTYAWKKKKRKEIKHFWIRELAVHNTTSFLVDAELSINFKNRATGFLFLQEKLNVSTEHAVLPI